MGANAIAAAASLLFFVASDYKNGRELWVSDGTRAGTHIVSNLSKGDYSTTIYQILPVRKGVVFSAHFYETSGYSAIYFSDGTRDGTFPLVEDESQSPLYFFGSIKGQHYFSRCGGGSYEFWRTNGTVSGTRHVKWDVEIGDLQCHVSVIDWKGKSVFFVRPEVFVPAYVAYSYDPKTNTVERLPIRIEPELGQSPRVAAANDKLVFVNHTRAHGSELWVWDESMTGPRLLRDIYPGRLGAFSPTWSYPFDGPITFGRKAYFLAMHPGTGMELWSTDGTTAGTRIVKDIVKGADSAQSFHWTSRSTWAFENKLFLVGKRFLLDVDGVAWLTDGTPKGTRPFRPRDQEGRDVYPTYGYSSFATTSNKIFFEGIADSGERNEPSQLYVTNIKTTRARIVKDINQTWCIYPNNYSSDIDAILNLAAHGNTIFFSANDKFTPDRGQCGSVESNTELWISNGTPKGTKQVKDIYPGVGGAIGRLYGHIGSNPEMLTIGGRR